MYQQILVLQTANMNAGVKMSPQERAGSRHIPCHQPLGDHQSAEVLAAQRTHLSAPSKKQKVILKYIHSTTPLCTPDGYELLGSKDKQKHGIARYLPGCCHCKVGHPKKVLAPLLIQHLLYWIYTLQSDHIHAHNITTK